MSREAPVLPGRGRRSPRVLGVGTPSTRRRRRDARRSVGTERAGRFGRSRARRGSGDDPARAPPGRPASCRRIARGSVTASSLITPRSQGQSQALTGSLGGPGVRPRAPVPLPSPGQGHQLGSTDPARERRPRKAVREEGHVSRGSARRPYSTGTSTRKRSLRRSIRRAWILHTRDSERPVSSPISRIGSPSQYFR